MIGIVSYLLISYFFTRIQATKAALLALTMNRLGDMGLSIGFFALFALLGTIDYSTVFSVAPYLNENAITIVSLLLFSGAMAKSAQVPLSTWLPGSMEAKRYTVIFIFFLFLVIYYITLIYLEYDSISLHITYFNLDKCFENITLLFLPTFIYLNVSSNNRDAKGEIY